VQKFFGDRAIVHGKSFKEEGCLSVCKVRILRSPGYFIRKYNALYTEHRTEREGCLSREFSVQKFFGDRAIVHGKSFKEEGCLSVQSTNLTFPRIFHTEVQCFVHITQDREEGALSCEFSVDFVNNSRRSARQSV
jgi:hypothetical protein